MISPHQINKQRTRSTNSPSPGGDKFARPVRACVGKEGGGLVGVGRRVVQTHPLVVVTPFGCDKGGIFSKRLQTRSSKCNSAESKKYALAPPRPPHTKRMKTT